MQLLPFGLIRLGARIFADFTFSVLRVRRKVAFENLTLAFPEKDAGWIRSVARRSNRNLFISLFELLVLPKFSMEALKENVELRDADAIRRILAQGKGLILLSGHFGNWEILALGLAALLHQPFTLLVKKQRNHFVDALITRYRTMHMNRIVYMHESVRKVLKILGQGGAIIIVADQSAPRESEYVPFFGREVATFRGPALFALRTGAPVLMAFTIRNPDDTYTIRSEELAVDDLEGTESERVRELTKRHTQYLEGIIREYPHLWLWQHRRWKHVREGDEGEDTN